MSEILNFGNGVLAGGSSRDAVRLVDHSGLDYPDVDVPINENAVVDGGSVGRARAKTRRMSVKLDFKRSGLTRAEVTRLFPPGAVRQLSSARGAMPYYVDGAVGFESPSIVGAAGKVTVPMVSPLAYPLAAQRLVDTGTTGGATFPLSFPLGFDVMNSPTSNSIVVESGGDVASLPLIIATLETSVSSLSVLVAGRTTTIVGALSAGDVVAIDSAAKTVTVNGVNRLSWFDREGRWPVLLPGLNEVSTDVLSRIVVSWAPRVMGLL